jgi:hypothetical protein
VTPGTRATYRVTLARAVEILGGVEPLSQRLGASVSELTRWIAGEEIPPAGILAKALDVLIEHSSQHKK